MAVSREDRNTGEALDALKSASFIPRLDVEKDPGEAASYTSSALTEGLGLPTKRESLEDSKAFEEIRELLRSGQKIGLHEASLILRQAENRLDKPEELLKLAESAPVLLVPSSKEDSLVASRVRYMFSEESEFERGPDLHHMGLGQLGERGHLAPITAALRVLGFPVVGVSLPTRPGNTKADWFLFVHQDL